MYERVYFRGKTKVDFSTCETGRLCLISSEVPCEGRGRKLPILRWHQYKCSKSLLFNYSTDALLNIHLIAGRLAIRRQAVPAWYCSSFPERPLRIGDVPGALPTLEHLDQRLAACHHSRRRDTYWQAALQSSQCFYQIAMGLMTVGDYW